MLTTQHADIIVIGGGPAGLTSAYSAKVSGANKVVLIERDNELGGILPQCIHTGFGLYEFGEELTGPEYAIRWIKRVRDAGVEILTGTMVLSISTDKEVTIMGISTGIITIKAKSIILAMGCREKTRGALGIPGYRPAGIFTAGCAQRLVNIEGLMPGKEIFVLGSGDIGLIMARRLTLEGAKVVAVCEKQDHPGGLERNVQQCLHDFNIPLILSSSIIEIHGVKRVEAVTLAEFDKQNKPIPETIRKIPCDTILLSVGLIPENELSRNAGIVLDQMTLGPVVNQDMETQIPGVFACGNVLKVYDLVDHVTEDAIKVGKSAFYYIKNSSESASYFTEDKEQSQTLDEKKLNIDCNSDKKKEIIINKISKDDRGMPLIAENKNIPEIRENKNGSDTTDVDSENEETFGADIKKITCTICPVGCSIKAYKDNEGNWKFKGYKCKRGLEYSKDEVTNPKRTLTTSILQKLYNDSDIETVTISRLVAVRSDKPVPLNKTREFVQEICKERLDKTVEIGDIALANVLGSGINIIVTRP